MTVAGGAGAPESDDLTARARIRDAALQHFADEGFAGSTIRGIARTARVSPGLVRHHFGSKEALRDACDEHVLQILRRSNDQLLADVGDLDGTPGGRQPYQRYVVRALAEGSSTAATIFDEMVTMTEQWLDRADQHRPEPPQVDRHIRAALVTAMAAGLPLLHEHVSRAMSTDMFGPEGERLLGLALLDIYANPLLSPELAAAARAGLERPEETAPHE